MRYWMVVLGLLAVTAVMLPVTRVTHTIIGTSQVLYALALGFLLVWMVWRAVQGTRE
jgi:uncharacterized membrane protein YtjA (UPF0391 family)